jgi:hypothetical protein
MGRVQDSTLTIWKSVAVREYVFEILATGALYD